MPDTYVQGQSISQQKICADLCQFLSENILAEGTQLSQDSQLASLGVDSFSLVELILFIERQYGIKLAEDRLTPDNLASVQALAACLVSELPTGEC